jgi:hypothetical protein
VSRTATALVALLVALISGCGGANDQQQVRDTVRQFIDASNKRDAKRFCDELVTQEFAEQATLQSGDRARDACKRQLRESKAPIVDVLRVSRVRVHEDEATATATLGGVGVEQRRVFRLKKEGGRWRVASQAGD